VAPSTLVCVVPNPSIDKTAEVDRLEPGRIHRPMDLVTVPGGKGLNVARAAAALGVPVEAVVLLGGHAGHWMDEELSRLGIRHTVAWATGETRSCLSVLDRSTGEMTEFYEAGMDVPDDAWQGFAARAAAAIARVREAGSAVVAISGSLPRGAPAGAAATLVRTASGGGAAVIVDTSGTHLAGAIAAKPDLVKVNAAEAAALLDTGVGTEAEAVGAARSIVDRGAHRAIVTRGRAGAVGWDGAAAWAVDAAAGGSHVVGSGDAFLAGFAAGMLRGDPFEACLGRATATATASTLVAGQGRVDSAEADRLMALTTVRRLA
jgi:1-phosphofructokinase family hexose kinase